jgi:release factor glutamine methyltransferase
MAVQQRRDDTVTLSWGAQLEWAEAILDAAGSPSPHLDALVLLMWLTGVPAAALLEHTARALSPDQATQYAAWTRRRAAREPVAYITGHKSFMGIDLYVDCRVLVVRPGTQTLVDTVLETVRLRPDESLLAADIGTGCGALALALAMLEPRFTHIYGADASSEVLEVARRNSARYHLDDRITWVEGDLLGPVPAPLDVIVANLPYLPDELPGVAPSVRRYEPHLAFFGGPDGLNLVRRLITQAPAKLRPGGVLALEMMPEQRDVIGRLLADALPQAEIRAGRQVGHNDHVIVAQLTR